MKKFKIFFFLILFFLILLCCSINYLFKKRERFQVFSSEINNRHCELFSKSIGICNQNNSDEIILPENFLKLIDTNKTILEIGPYLNPQLKGSNIKYFDILSTQDLKNQISRIKDASDNYVDEYFIKNYDLTKLPQINYVNTTGDMSEINERFDIIFSSHNIEHQIDLITHLNQVSNLLNSGGEFFLIIPDKRYCFDHFIPETPLSDIIANHYENYKTRHPLRSVLANECEVTHNNAFSHWKGHHEFALNKNNNECYKKTIEKFQKKEGAYINAHRWRFTPNQFEYIIDELYQLKYINLKVKKIYITKNKTFQFYAILYKP